LVKTHRVQEELAVGWPEDHTPNLSAPTIVDLLEVVDHLMEVTLTNKISWRG
jgi:hypothetical protein